MVPHVLAFEGSAMNRVWVVVMAAAAGFLGGCDKSCQDSCDKIYGECQVAISGVPTSISLRDCVTTCETALGNAGVMGDYDPWKRNNPLDPNEITNERQAAAWMECVAETSCEDLDPSVGLCSPI